MRRDDVDGDVRSEESDVEGEWLFGREKEKKCRCWKEGDVGRRVDIEKSRL